MVFRNDDGAWFFRFTIAGRSADKVTVQIAPDSSIEQDMRELPCEVRLSEQEWLVLDQDTLAMRQPGAGVGLWIVYRRAYLPLTPPTPATPK